MPHSIHVGFLGVNDFAHELIQAIIDKGVIPEKNIYVSDASPSSCAQYEGRAISVFKDDMTTLIKAELVIITAPRREFGTVLAPICALTRGKIIVAMTEGIDCNFVLDRVTKGTYVVSAAPHQSDAGEWETSLEYSAGFPEYMKAACIDIVGSICKPGQ
ncbi:NAD(P)-binding domain-containing protein [Intestinibacillus massiliensis]|nr:NAD(P)-binding domain-containing protein [Intestinibacillus massiliensis]